MLRPSLVRQGHEGTSEPLISAKEDAVDPAGLRAVFLAGVAGTFLFALAMWALVLGAVYTGAGKWSDANYHFILESLSFGVLAPIATITYRFFRDYVGWSHQVVKAIHAVLHTAATTMGIVGIAYMWTAHDNSATAIAAKGQAVHFSSVHSWIAMASMSLYVLIAALSLVIFYCTGPKLRAAWKQWHGFLGGAAAAGTFASIFLGLTSLVGRGDNESTKELLWKTAALMLFMVGLSVGLVFFVTATISARRLASDGDLQ